MGRRLVIEGVGPRVAADTGGAIKGRRLDIWEPSAAACTRFGRKQLRVWQAGSPTPSGSSLVGQQRIDANRPGLYH